MSALLLKNARLDGYPQPQDLLIDNGSIARVTPSGSPSDVDAEPFPGEGLLEDALADIAGEEEYVWSIGHDSAQESQLCDAKVLGLVDNDMRIRLFGAAFPEVLGDHREQIGRGQ